MGHLYRLLESRRRLMGLSQQELGARAGLSREKINRMENQAADLWISELAQLMDVLGLEIAIKNKSRAGKGAIAPSVAMAADAFEISQNLIPRGFEDAKAIDGRGIRVINWGKSPS